MWTPVAVGLLLLATTEALAIIVLATALRRAEAFATSLTNLVASESDEEEPSDHGSPPARTIGFHLGVRRPRPPT